MDFLSAGYMGGGVEIPRVSAKKELTPSGEDDSVAIQAAIDEMAKLTPTPGFGFRGAVLLKPGKFN